MLSVKQGGINNHFWVFGMTWPGIELWSPEPLANTLLISQLARLNMPKVGDLSRWWLEGSLFVSYYTNVWGRALLFLDWSTLPLILSLCCWVLSKSLVWLNQGLNPGLPDHQRTLYSLGQISSFYLSCLVNSLKNHWNCGLVSLFNGISTFEGYLMPKPFS